MRPKTVHELRQEIMASSRLRAEPQEVLSQKIGVNQATVSRILRGQFKRRSKAVDKLIVYASISCITDTPVNEFDATVIHLERLAAARSPNGHHAAKLIRLAAELLESSLPDEATGSLPAAQPGA